MDYILTLKLAGAAFALAPGCLDRVRGSGPEAFAWADSRVAIFRAVASNLDQSCVFQGGEPGAPLRCFPFDHSRR